MTRDDLMVLVLIFGVLGEAMLLVGALAFAAHIGWSLA